MDLRGFGLRGQSSHSNDDHKTSVEDKVDRLFASQEPLFERLHTEPKASRVIGGIKSAAKSGTKHISKMPTVAKVASVIVVLGAIGGVVFAFNRPNSSINQVAGDSNKGINETSSASDPIIEKPKFKVFVPTGKAADDYKIARVSPEGNDLAYAYGEVIEDTRVIVSQQELPDKLKKDQALNLEEVAKSYGATNQFQTGSQTVYHGSTVSSGVQSLVFIKGNRLIFIRAEKEIANDKWTAFINGLHQ